MSRRPNTFIVFLIILCSSWVSKAEPSRQQIDSLYNKAWDAVATHPDSTLYYGKLQLELAKEINYRLGMVNAHYILGYANDELNYFDVAAKEYYDGLALIDNHQGYDFQRKKMLIYKCLGVAYDNTFGHKLAVSYYSEALSIADKLNIKNNIAQLNYNIGYAQLQLENYSSALSHLVKAEEVYQELDERINIVSTYNLIGVLFDKQENYEAAREYYLKALAISSDENDIEMGKLYANLGENYLLDGKFEKALIYYRKALPIFQESQHSYYSQLIYNNIGDVFLKKEMYHQSIPYYKKAINLAEKDVFEEEYKRANESISLAYEKMGEYEKAVSYKNQYIAQTKILSEVKDNLFRQNAQYRMKEMEWQLERELKEQEIHNMEQVNFWFKISMSLLILILATASYKAYRYYSGIKAVKKWLASQAD